MVTGQRLIDQKNNISNRKWLSDLELEEIQRNTEYIRNGEVGLEGNEYEQWFLRFDHEGQDVLMKECEVVPDDCMVPNVEKDHT